MPASRVPVLPSEARIAFLGGGVMGEAIIAGLIASGAVSASQIAVIEPREERRSELAAAHGVDVFARAHEALPADVVVLAVKPQVIEEVVSDIAGLVGDAVVVSIAAGVSTARLEALLPAGAHVVRVMPNTPAMVGAGMAIVSGGSEATDADVALVEALFSAVGKAVVVDERHQDAATAISGSGPAYFALVIDAMARAGVAHGLTRAVAEQLAVQTMLGTAQMIERTGMHPGALMDGVASPGGTTIAAVNRLEAGGVRAAFAEAVGAAVARAKELGG